FLRLVICERTVLLTGAGDDFLTLGDPALMDRLWKGVGKAKGYGIDGTAFRPMREICALANVELIVSKRTLHGPEARVTGDVFRAARHIARGESGRLTCDTGLRPVQGALGLR